MVAELSKQLQELQLQEGVQRIRIIQLEDQVMQLNGSKSGSMKNRNSMAALSATEKCMALDYLNAATPKVPEVVGRVKKHIQKYEELSGKPILVMENVPLTKPTSEPIHFDGYSSDEASDMVINNVPMESEQTTNEIETEKERLPAMVHQVFTNVQQSTILKLFVTERSYVSKLASMKVFDV